MGRDPLRFSTGRKGIEAATMLNMLEVLANQQGRRAALTCGADDLLGAGVAYIAGSKNSGNAGFQHKG